MLSEHFIEIVRACNGSPRVRRVHPVAWGAVIEYPDGTLAGVLKDGTLAGTRYAGDPYACPN